MKRDPTARLAKAALPVWKKLVFGLVPLLVVLLAAELVARVIRGPFWFASYRLLRVDQIKKGYPAITDSRLGYVPKPSFRSRDNRWGTLVTIDADSFRSNGSEREFEGRAILAVGDSFTFGDQVDDDETWPAFLEQDLERAVKNGGVFGYSLGQSILRAEKILSRMRAEWLIVSFISDDFFRCELSRRYAAKPYFDTVAGKLVLRNVPVSEHLTSEETANRRLKNVLGYSALLDMVFANTAARWWILDEKEIRVHQRGEGVPLAKLLIDRAAAKCREKSCKLLLVAQGDVMDAASNEVISYARRAGLPIVDLITAFAQEVRADPRLRHRYFHGHMTAAGNRWAAAKIARAIQASPSHLGTGR